MTTTHAFTLFALLAACSTEETPDVSLPADVKVNGDVEHYVSGRSLYVFGDAGAALYDILDRSDAFYETQVRGVDVIVGRYTACAMDGDVAECKLTSSRIEESLAGFAVAVHGARFQSAASELFGALAYANDIDPSTVADVEDGRWACGKTSTDVWCGLQPAEQAVLELSFDGLEDLGADYVYEGWIVAEGGPVTSGRFDAPADGALLSFAVDEALAASARMFVLTIEPRFGDDPAPADTHLVAGAFAQGEAVLTVEHPAALGTELIDDASGGFLLGTPTSANVAEDYAQGVWFINPGTVAQPGLALPVLPAGWAYEGWVVTDAGPLSTGRFVDVAAADSDGAGPAAGPDAAPPFPGQDYIDPAMSLLGTTIVISVEPEPDNSPAPFTIKPLRGGVVDAGGGVFQMLDSTDGATNPMGVATLR